MTSELKVDKISPASGTSFTLGDSGDTYTVPSGATLSIAGTINASSGTATGFDGTHVLLDSGTISNAANVTFNNSLITSTYNKYVVEFINCKLASDTHFSLFGSTDNGSNYGTSNAYQITGAIFETTQSNNALATRNNNDGADGTLLGNAFTIDNAYVFGCNIEIYNPTSTNQQKGFLFRGFYTHTSGDMAVAFGGGAFREGGNGAGTTAVNNIKFQAGSGNITSGIYRLYGVA